MWANIMNFLITTQIVDFSKNKEEYILLMLCQSNFDFPSNFFPIDIWFQIYYWLIFQHYNLSSENLQFIALKLSCKARSLLNEIDLLKPQQSKLGSNQNGGASSSKQKVDTLTMSAVADVVDALMTMLDWLNNPTFGTQMISAGEMTIDYKTFSQW